MSKFIATKTASGRYVAYNEQLKLVAEGKNEDDLRNFIQESLNLLKEDLEEAGDKDIYLKEIGATEEDLVSYELEWANENK